MTCSTGMLLRILTNGEIEIIVGLPEISDISMDALIDGVGDLRRIDTQGMQISNSWGITEILFITVMGIIVMMVVVLCVYIYTCYTKPLKIKGCLLAMVKCRASDTSLKGVNRHARRTRPLTSQDIEMVPARDPSVAGGADHHVENMAGTDTEECTQPLNPGLS